MLHLLGHSHPRHDRVVLQGCSWRRLRALAPVQDLGYRPGPQGALSHAGSCGQRNLRHRPGHLGLQVGSLTFLRQLFLDKNPILDIAAIRPNAVGKP